MAAGNYTIKDNAIAVSGGALKDQAWLIQVKKIGEANYYTLKKADYKLAKVLGFPTSDTRTKHFGDNQFLDYLAYLRDEKVDAMIKQWAIDEDPMGEDSGCSDKLTGPRCKLFADANVPEEIEISHPPFTTNDGTRFAEYTMKVISTPSRNIHVTVEMTGKNLDFMSVAAHYCQYDAHTEQNGDQDDSDELACDIGEPNVHWAKVKTATGDQWRLSCCCRLENGKWKTHYKKVNLINGAAPGVNNQILASAANELQHFYNENHIARPEV